LAQAQASSIKSCIFLSSLYARCHLVTFIAMVQSSIEEVPSVSRQSTGDVMDKPQVRGDKNHIAPSRESAHVSRLKLILEDSNVSPDIVLNVLSQLDPCLSLHILQETGIGKTINQLAKRASDTNVRSKATELVAEWRRRCLKRSSDNAGAGANKHVCLSSDGVTSEGASSLDSTGTPVSKSEMSASEYFRKMRSLQCTKVAHQTTVPRQTTLLAASVPKPSSSSNVVASKEGAEKMQRRVARKKGGEAALLAEVERYLKENRRNASLNDLNLHIATLWSEDPIRTVVDKTRRIRGQDDPPVLGKKFVERNQHILELKKKFKPTKGSKKNRGEGFFVGCWVHLKR